MDRVNSVQELIERTQGMPLERMRFFINEDRREPRCFGIYQEADTGRWVVYKNKDDGSRAVRYSGPDEAYAAQELWAKINSEIGLRRAKLPKQRTKAQKVRRGILIGLAALAIGAGSFFVIRAAIREPHRGYYTIGDDLYYYQDDSWYWYDGGYWLYYDEPWDYDDYRDSYYGEYYDDFEDEDDAFEKSPYYTEPSSDNSDSSIFDSWDSSDTDWSSDW